jgi:UDP-3-O-[3-hydroxymyristoyl] glucosamine N-acyltransferase
MGIALHQPATLGELARRFGGQADAGVQHHEVMELAAPQDAGPGSALVVLTSARYLEAAAATASPLLCGAELGARLDVGRRWVHPQPMWVVSRLLGELPPYACERWAAAHVHAEADVAESAFVAAGAVIHKGASIGADCQVRENAVIFGGVRLGQRVIVGPLSVIGRPGFGWTRDAEGTLIRVPQLGGVWIDDDVEVGPLCTVDGGTLGPTRIGAGVKLDAQVHVGHNVQLGEGVMVAGQAGFAGSAVLGAGVLVGGQAGVTDHARIGAGARIAAHSGVIGDVPAGQVVAGFPAVSRVRWLRAMARLLRVSARQRS